jgi:hypothetical protein
VIAFAGVFLGSVVYFFADDFFEGFLATFFAVDFLTAFFVVFLLAFFNAFPDFLATGLLLAARFFAAAFLPALARGDLRTFFALRFFDVFFFGVATTNSFMT